MFMSQKRRAHTARLSPFLTHRDALTNFHSKSYTKRYHYCVTTEEKRSTRSWHLVVVAFYRSLAYNPCLTANHRNNYLLDIRDL